MTNIEEIVITFLDKEVINKTKEIEKNIKQIVSIEKFGMDFRLIKITDKTINFEIICFDQELGCVYTKPIGIYHSNGGLVILNEFREAYLNLLKNKQIPINQNVSFLTLIQNAIIASFSIEALYYAKKMEDVSFFANGLEMEIFMTYDGDSQSFLNDKYNIKGPIGYYDFRGENEDVAPMMEYKKIYDGCLKHNLLTLFNRV